jgi:CRP/FNR family transcriptional regulator, cyclic AMP receptor protein
MQSLRLIYDRIMSSLLYKSRTEGDQSVNETAFSLDEIDLLRALSADERAGLSRQCGWKRYSPQEQIIDRQSEDTDVCFVVEGTVRVVVHSLIGREISFDDVSAGGFFGELAAIDCEPRSASIVSVTPSLIAFMPGPIFRRVVSSHPDVALRMMERLVAIVRTSTNRIVDLTTLGANNRVNAEILRLGKDHMTGANQALISPIPIHSDIASRVSVTRETVARVLSELNRVGLVTKSSRGLLIRDFDQLQHMVNDVRGE